MFLGLSKGLLARAVLGGVLGVALAGGCRPEAAGQECYGQQTLPPYDSETGVAYICDEAFPVPRRFPEFEDTELVNLTLDEVDTCPMCPAELDELFWQAFLDEVDDLGLAEGEDPDCVNQGYAIEIACLSQMQEEGSCRYRAIVASHCALADLIIPLEPSGSSPANHTRSRP